MATSEYSKALRRELALQLALISYFLKPTNIQEIAFDLWRRCTVYNQTNLKQVNGVASKLHRSNTILFSWKSLTNKQAVEVQPDRGLALHQIFSVSSHSPTDSSTYRNPSPSRGAQSFMCVWSESSVHNQTPQSPRTVTGLDPTKSWENKIITWRIGKN